MRSRRFCRKFQVDLLEVLVTEKEMCCEEEKGMVWGTFR